jgi:hypothetical protein
VSARDGGGDEGDAKANKSGHAGRAVTSRR